MSYAKFVKLNHFIIKLLTKTYISCIIRSQLIMNSEMEISTFASVLCEDISYVEIIKISVYTLL